MKIKGDFIKNEELLYTDTTNPEAEEYYVYECEIEDLLGDQYIDLSNYWGSLNYKRYSTYMARILGRDENRNEEREYIKKTSDGIYVNDWKVGDIIKFNKWDHRRYNHETRYHLIVEKTNDVIRTVFESTYLKAKKLYTYGYSVVRTDNLYKV